MTTQTLVDVFGSQQALDEFCARWNCCEPAPENSPEWAIAVHEQCFEQCGFEIGTLPKDEYVAIMVSALDALPNGTEAATAAACAKLVEIATAGGWNDLLS